MLLDSACILADEMGPESLDDSRIQRRRTEALAPSGGPIFGNDFDEAGAANGGRAAHAALRDKRGEVPLDDVLAEAERLGPALEAARDSSPLPARADVERIDALLRTITTEVARRHVVGEPGLLGRDASPPPTAHWEDE